MFKKVVCAASLLLTLMPRVGAQNPSINAVEELKDNSHSSAVEHRQSPTAGLGQEGQRQRARPLPSTPLLRGSVKGAQLEADAKSSSQYTGPEEHSSAGALQGGAREDLSPINTIQRKGAALFNSDFSGRSPQLDGNLDRAKSPLQGEIERMRTPTQGALIRATPNPDIQLGTLEVKPAANVSQDRLLTPASRVPLHGEVIRATPKADIQLDSLRPLTDPSAANGAQGLLDDLQRVRIPLHAEEFRKEPQQKIKMESQRPLSETDLKRPEVDTPIGLDHVPAPLHEEVTRATRRPASDTVPDLNLERSRPKVQIEPDIARVQLTTPPTLERASQNTNGIPERLPDLPKSQPSILNTEREHEKVYLERVEPQVEGKLARKQQEPGNNLQDISAQANRLKPQLSLVRAKTEVHAVFRQPVDTIELVASAKLASLNDDGADGISWDHWYEELAKQSEPLLFRTIEARGGPKGNNSISITVWQNNHVEVSLVRPSNSNFDAAALEAYGSLDGNKALSFPTGSRRQKVTFFIDVNRDLEGGLSGVSSQTCVGDKEIVRK